MNWHAWQLREQLKNLNSDKDLKIKALKEGTEGKEFIKLEEENIKLKEKLAKLKTELTENDNIVDGLAQESQQKDQEKLDLQTFLAETKQVSKNKVSQLEKELREFQLYHQRTIRKKDEKQQAVIKEKTKDLTKENTHLLSIKDYLEKTLEEVNNSYISLSEEIQLLEKELKGEKQLNQAEKSTSHQKVKHLKKELKKLQVLLNKPKKEVAIQTDLSTTEQGTQTLVNYEEIIQDKEQAIRALKLDKEELLSLNTATSEKITKLQEQQEQKEQLITNLTDLNNQLTELIKTRDQRISELVTLLNKPTNDQGTQTDLIGEQINKWEVDLVKQTEDILTLNSTITELKEQLLTSNNPEIHKIENQLLAKVKEIETKKEQLDKLVDELEKAPIQIETIGLTREEKVDSAKEEKVKELRAEIIELEQQADKLRQLLTQISPDNTQELKQELNSLQKKLYHLNYLSSLESSLQARALENTQYLTRIERAEEKWGSSEKKLELIRDLLSSNQISRLSELYKKGQI